MKKRKGSILRRWLAAIFALIISVSSFGAYAACTNDQIDVAGDGTNCIDTKFTLTTTATGTFQFSMTAKGTFYVDCGNGGTLTSDSATNYPVNGKIVDRTYGTSLVTYTCTWDSATAQTIKFAGTATYYPWSSSNAAISFWVGSSDSNKNSNAQKIASISGNLSAMFPYNTNATQNGYQPRFYQTFKYARTLTGIPDTLFANYTNGATYMFYETFYNCVGLTSIPENLFGNITNGAERMFYQTFYSCTGLRAMPEHLFGNITTGAESMFYQTFNSCSNMQGYIPPSTFAGLIANGSPTASYMWYYTFSNTRLTSYCSGNTTQYFTGYENSWNYNVSCISLSPMEITLDTTGATTTVSPNTVYQKYNTGWYSDSDGNNAITQLTTLPTKTGYAFGGFYTGENGTGTMVIDSAGNFLISTLYEPTTLYAYFGTGYNVTYSCGDGTGTPPADQTAIGGTQFITATNTCSKTGYLLIGWAVSNTNDIVGNRFVWNYNENKTLTAQWVEEKFALTTISSDTFQFTMSARGTFYVDCGNGGTLTSSSATNYPVNAGIVDRTYGTNDVTYTCSWATSAIQTIKFGGTATGYTTDTSASAPAAISFYLTSSSISAISGNLSAMFPYDTNAAQNGYQPRFRHTFYGASALTTIPGTLFTNYTIGATYMFNGTFAECKHLTSIPENLFGNFTTGAEHMFDRTFSYCNSLTSVPENLFGHITTGAPYMFSETFSNCYGLTSIPEKLFSSFTTGANRMFSKTFYYCSGLTSIPEKLFSTFTTGANYMFEQTFYNCTGLTSIPEKLFSSFTTGAEYMFSSTFYGCTGLTSIPEKLFSSFTTGAEYMFQQTFYGCTGLTSIPEKLFSTFTTGANSMFADTFFRCTGLTSIPEKLFSTFTTGANNMFSQTFYGCTGLTSIPEDLFSSFTTGAERMFYATFYGCTGLTSIPEKLFSNFTTASQYMFYSTFYGCSNITGYIPPSTFAGLFTHGSPTASNMWYSTFSGTQLAQNSCPSGTTEYTTGYKGVTNGWGNYVSCFEDTMHTCSAGEFLPKLYNSCAACPGGKYCTGGDYSFSPSADQGITGDCSAGAYSTSGASSATCTPCSAGMYSASGATTCSACPAGKYSTGGAAECTACSAGTYSDTTGATACTACTGRNQYSAAGAESCSTVSSGYYSTGCNENNNACTGQERCNGFVYCSNGVKYDCPTAADHRRTTFPESYGENPEIVGSNMFSGTGWTAITQCKIENRVSGTRGSCLARETFNETTEKYDISVDQIWSIANAGYYLTGPQGCGSSFGYYSEAKTCPSGSYCPGASYATCTGGTQPATFGLEACPNDYPNSNAGATAQNQCYLTTTAGKYVNTANAAQTSCPINSYCAGGIDINYGSTGGINACASGTYSPSGSAVCYPHILHVGDNNVYLKSTKQTTPSFNVKIGNDTFYANMTRIPTKMNQDSTRYFRAQWGNNNYYVCDDTTYGTYDFSTLDASVGGTDATYDASNKTWDTTFPYGMISGLSLCSTTEGTFPYTGTPEENTIGYNCWCKATEYKPNGSYITYNNSFPSRWAFEYKFDSVPACTSSCGYNCSVGMKIYENFRQQVFRK